MLDAGSASKARPRHGGSAASYWARTTLWILLCVVFVLLYFNDSDGGGAVSTTTAVATIAEDLAENSVAKKSENLELERGHKVKKFGRIHAASTVSSRKVAPYFNDTSMPDFERFWTPIDIRASKRSSQVTLCQLDWKQYNENPHQHAMFKDLVAMSNCNGNNRKSVNLDDYIQQVDNEKNNMRYAPPTGFIFHESRVGSTLVANLFGTDPHSLVFAESPPIANVLMHCQGCDRKDQINILRQIVKAMGVSPFHKRLFFKCQSITSTKMSILLEAFPDTPWGFVYRKPVQTMMSQLDPDKGVGGPCLRSMSAPPERVSSVARKAGGSNPPSEAWCAAHLNMLCTFAIESYQAFSKDKTNTEHQRGMLINYEGLPGIIPKVILPMFGVSPSEEWVRRMAIESGSYSKKNIKSKKFEGDSEKKERKASDKVNKYAEEILEPTYQKMLKMTLESIKSVTPGLYEEFIKDGTMNWDVIKVIDVQI